MKRIITYIAFIIMMFAHNNVFSADLPNPKGKYISDICVMATDTWAITYAMSVPFDYINNVLGEGWKGAVLNSTSAYGDLNAGKGDYRVFILYKVTDNPKEAITDLLVVCNNPKDYSYNCSANKTFTVNGKRYYPAKYSTSNEDSKVCSGSVDSGNGNLNRGTGQSTNNLYLYYTKDGNVDEEGYIVPNEHILTNLTIIHKDSKYEGTEFVKMYNPYTGEITSYADCNKGAGGNYVYIKMNDRHQHIDLDATQALTKCSCGEIANPVSKPKVDQKGVYMIQNLSQLCWWRDEVNKCTDESLKLSAKLCKDIDMTNVKNMGQWPPICPINDNGKVWTGTFDGDNHKLLNFGLELGEATSGFGLFGVAGGTIQNLTMQDVSINTGNYTCAALAVLAKGELNITNCKVTGSISGNSLSAAGFVNVNDDQTKVTISHSVNEAQIKSVYVDGTTAGFVNAYGRSTSSQNVNIQKCINKGTATFAFAKNPIGTIMNCLNTAAQTALIDTYTDAKKLCMKYVLNAAHDKIDRQEEYMADSHNGDNVYAIHLDDEASYGEGLLLRSQISNGNACYLMNGERSDENVVWRQAIGTDAIPTPLHNDDDITRIVYFFDKSTFYCSHLNYTNYRFYAEDQHNGDHMYTFSLGSVVNGKLQINLNCTVCGNSYVREAEKVSERVVWNPTCIANGSKMVCYKLSNPERIFYVDEVINKNSSFSESRHFSQGNIIYEPLDGVPNAMEKCKYCGQRRPRYSHTKTSKENGWEIEDIHDLVAYLQECYYKDQAGKDSPNGTLMNDIDMSEASDLFCQWLEPSYNRNFRNAFFNGNGHKITGLRFNIMRTTGLFGKMYNDTIKNLTVEGVVTEPSHAALLGQYAENSVFENVQTQGYVEGTMFSAGICADAKDCVFNNCHNYAQVYASGTCGGGLVGNADGGTMLRCTNRASIDGRTATNVGGLAGSYMGMFGIHNCGNYGDVMGHDRVGGIVGAFAAPTLDMLSANNVSHFYNILNAGNIYLTGESYNKGGLVGRCQRANEKDDTEVLVQYGYFRGSQIKIGTIDGKPIGIAFISNITNEQLHDGTVCQWLNQKQAENVWLQSLDEPSYPYPNGYGKHENNLFVNGKELYVAENSNMENLSITPDENGKDRYFHTDVPFTVSNIKYRREAELTTGKYATLFLPFSFNDDRLKVMQFDHYDDVTGKVYFAQVVGATEPNHPYLVRLADDFDEEKITLVISAEDAQIEPTEDGQIEFGDDPVLETGFYGTYIQSTLYGTLDYYAFSAKYGDFRKASDNGNNISPFRCTFKLASGNGVRQQLILVSTDNTDNDPTNVNMLSDKIVEMDAHSAVYNLSGQQVSTSVQGLKSGLYIRDGKKICVK